MLPHVARASVASVAMQEPAPRLGQGYAVISVCTLLAWTLTAIMALARHPLVTCHKTSQDNVTLTAWLDNCDKQVTNK